MKRGRGRKFIEKTEEYRLEKARGLLAQADYHEQQSKLNLDEAFKILEEMAAGIRKERQESNAT